MKICVVGAGRHGKDSVCQMLEKHTGLKFAGTTSLYLAEHMAKVLETTVEDAYARRHESEEMRLRWFNEANSLRDGDPLALVNMALANGDITGGMRDPREMAAVAKAGIFDLVIWVEDERKPPDASLKFGREVADIVLRNDHGLEELERRVSRLSNAMGFHPRSAADIDETQQTTYGINDYFGELFAAEAAKSVQQIEGLGGYRQVSRVLGAKNDL